MDNKKILFFGFILLVLTQLYVPANMILSKEDILRTGKEYKFKTAPIDPSDPFRGKYITLRYEENSIIVEGDNKWVQGETIYVLFSSDSLGFAKIKSIASDKPKDRTDFLKMKAGYVTTGTGVAEVDIDYPFDRYYLEESKAEEAELAYNESQSDTVQASYALVSIKNGEAVLKDVMIGNVSVKELKDNVLFLRKLVEGGSEHSFGIHVAKMAGMPQQVLHRANKILKKLEKSHSSEELTDKVKTLKDDDMQLSFFNLDDPLLENIKEEILHIDIDTLTPVEALMKLNEIKRMLVKKKRA